MLIIILSKIMFEHFALFQLQKIPTSLLDKLKIMNQVHPQFPSILKTNQKLAEMM